jgi:hypothetical protein
MATLDNINLFAVGGATDDTQDPLYPEYLALVEQFEAMKDMPTIPGGYPDAPSFAQFKRQKQAEVARDIMTENLESGDIKKAYEEGFTQLPITEQLGVYVNPITGVPVETYETGYFADEAGFQMKKPGEALLDLVNPLSSPLEKLPFTVEDPMSAMLAPLSAAGAIGGVGELANIPKAGLMALRRYQQKSMDGGGGGGIGGLPKPQQETTKDLAGYKSNVYEEAKAVADELSPKALLQYLKSNKRTNPQNNKLGIGLKQTELDEIDFDAFEAEMNRVYPDGNFEKQELLDYINDNRVRLYRIKRTENPTVKIIEADDERNVQEIDWELDEPMTMELRQDKAQMYYDDYQFNLDTQINFADVNFGPTGFITEGNFKLGDKDFIDKFNDTYDSTDYENPFSEENVSMFDAFDADGTFYESIPPSKKSSDAVKRYLDAGFTVRPKVMDESFDTDRLRENASETRVDFEANEGLADEYYSYEGQDGNQYTLIGNESDGFNVGINGSFDDTLGEYIPYDEARIQVSGRINENLRDEGVVVDSGVDNAYNDADFKYTVSDDVVTGDATLPVKYAEYDTFRLPMGGATDYEEYTVHIDNPKTKTRYSRDYGEKHYGGGDELFHIRTSIRTDENGKKVLFVEEIQSDLHSTARSTKSDATYELPRKEQQKIMQQLEEFGIKQDPTRIRATKGGIFKNTEGEDTFVDYGSLPYIAKAITQGRTENFGSKNADDFVKTFGFEKTKEIGKIAEKLYQGELPDFPYKKDWVDLAVKEALKIGAEKNVDRIAFTNAPTQVKRNQKSVYYNQDIIVNKLPTREELPDTPEFEKYYKNNLETYYKDYVNHRHNTNLPIPTMDEFYASIPAARRKSKKLEKEILSTSAGLKQRAIKDLAAFRQKYPDSKDTIDDLLDRFKNSEGPAPIKAIYLRMRDAEIQTLADRANDAFDITSDPRNVDVTNPALARLLDAELEFNQIPEDVAKELGDIDNKTVQKSDLDAMVTNDKESIKEITVDQLAREFKLDDYKYKLEKVGYPVEGDELLNPQKIQLEGDDYDNMRYGTRMLDGEEALAVELGEDLGPKTIEKLQSGKSQVVIPKDELEGSGMKFLEIYKNEIPRGINKVLKDLKVKEVKPSISDVLFSKEDIDSDIILQEYIKQKNAPKDEFGLTSTVFDPQVETHSSIGIDLTNDMKRKILQEGLNNMYMGGKVSKSNSMDRPIAGNVREM